MPKRIPHSFKLAGSALAISALLAACGGGDASAPGTSDTTPPTVAITDNVVAATATATGNVTFTFTFSEAVSGFTADDVTVQNGAKGTFTMASDNKSATLVVTPTANSTGTINVSVAASAFVDLATNANTAGATASQNYDTTTPTTTIATFDESQAATLVAFEGTSFSATTDNGNKVAQLDKPTTAQPYGGATFQTCPANTVGNTPAIPFSASAKKMSLRVKAPRAGVVFTLKAEGTGNNAGAAVMAQATSSGTGWETLTFDFSNKTAGTDLDTGKVYNVISVFPNWTEVTTDTANRTKETQNSTYYFDDLKLVGLSTSLASCPAQNTSAPTTAPTTPTATGVISIYSDAYTATAGVDLNPNWGQSTAVTEATIAGNKVQKYANINYQGIDFANNPINVSSKSALHIDLWSADATSVDVYIISIAAGVGTEQKYTVNLTASQWTSTDIALSNYSTPDKTAIKQIKLVANPSATTVYMDNLYFK